MDANNNDNYVLVLEDRTEVKNEAEVGKLSVVSNIDEKGKLKTAPAEEANQGDFFKFNNRDGLLKNFMSNFLKQFNEPKPPLLIRADAIFCLENPTLSIFKEEEFLIMYQR